MNKKIYSLLIFFKLVKNRIKLANRRNLPAVDAQYHNPFTKPLLLGTAALNNLANHNPFIDIEIILFRQLRGNIFNFQPKLTSNI